MSDNPILRDLPDEGYGLECDWGGCGHTAVKERQVATGVWLPVCACCAHKPDLSPPEKAYEDALGIIQDDGERIAALTAENARLRGELAAVQPELEAMQARAVALDTVVSEHSALTADLARVTGEREEWRKAEEEAGLACALMRVERDNVQEEKRRAGLDAAAECGRLRAELAEAHAEIEMLSRGLADMNDAAVANARERDALLAAAMTVNALTEEIHIDKDGCTCLSCRTLDTLRAAIAAVTPPASGEE